MTDNEDRKGQTSASNAAADFACPGRHLAGRGLPDLPNEYQEIGSKVHAALADSGTQLMALTFEERQTFDACRDLERKLHDQFFGPNPDPQKNPTRVFREQRYWARWSDNDLKYEHSGQPDVIFRQGTKALICEYKTLAGDVPESPRNMQLRDQAVLARGHFVTLTEIAVAVIQPMVTHSPEICLYDLPSLEKATADMFARVMRSNDHKSPRLAGVDQCKFCRARLSCPQYQTWATGLLPALRTLDVPMAQWTPEQRGLAASALPAAQKYLDELKDWIKAGIKADPAFCPGWGLDEGKRREAINDPQKCFERFTGLGGTLDQFMAAITIKKTALKEAVQEVTQTKGKALDTTFRQLTDGIVTVTQTEPSLVKIKDAQ